MASNGTEVTRSSKAAADNGYAIPNLDAAIKDIWTTFEEIGSGQ